MPKSLSGLNPPTTTNIYSRFAWLLLLFLISCNSEQPIQISYQLERTDFIEKINSRGTIQSTNTVTLVSPDVWTSNMTVIFLAEDGEPVKKGDTVCILDAGDLLFNLESTSISLDGLKADLEKLKVDQTVELSLLEAQLEEINGRLALNSLDSIQKKFAPEVKQRIFALELEKAGIEKEKIEKKYKAQKQINAAELRSMNSRIKRRESDVQRWLDQISMLYIVSPQDGVVLHTEIQQFQFQSSSGTASLGGKIRVNSRVFGNMALLQIPDLSKMEVVVEVPETDYKRIRPGQKVFIHVEAAADLKTTGLIKRKTLIGKQNERDAKVKMYEVIVSVDSCHTKMKPGLSAACEIIVDEAKDTVVVPTLAIFERDSLKIVYVAEKDKFIPVPVEVGHSNSSVSIISKGLSGNEIIALVEPSHKKIAKIINTSMEPANKTGSIPKDTLNHNNPNH